jgi:hypothetical protein
MYRFEGMHDRMNVIGGIGRDENGRERCNDQQHDQNHREAVTVKTHHAIKGKETYLRCGR